MAIIIPAWVDGMLQPVEKLDAHLRGLRHKAVSIFVISGDYILIQQRAMCKYHTPGQWANTCCTHPDWQEDPHRCATRRLNEELGITKLPLHHRGQVEYRAHVGRGLIEHEVVEVYTAHTKFNLQLAPNPEEVMATRWVSITDLQNQLATTPEIFTPWLHIYMEQHSEMIFKEMAGV